MGFARSVPARPLPRLVPHMRFVFLGPEIPLRLPSDRASRHTPLPSGRSSRSSGSPGDLHPLVTSRFGFPPRLRAPGHGAPRHAWRTSGRRPPFGGRPPTPPCVRLRTRRFRSGSSTADASGRGLRDRRLPDSGWARRRACDSRQHSTMAHDHSPLISRPGRGPVLVPAAFVSWSSASSTGATGCSASGGEAICPSPRKSLSHRPVGSSSPSRSVSASGRHIPDRCGAHGPRERGLTSHP